MTDVTSLRVGLVGLGNIGRNHADELDELGATIAGGVDIDADVRQSFAEAFDAETFGEPAPLYDLVDAVVITTPNRFHEEYAVGALDAGCPVLLEKPLAHTLESAQRIATAAEESDAFCMVGFHNRYSSHAEIVKAYDDRGRFGELTHVEATYVRRRGVPARGTWFTDADTAGGGALVDIGSHAIDLALWLYDFPEVEEVTGTTRTEFGSSDAYTAVEPFGDTDEEGPYDVEDSASAFVRCAGGRTISLEVAWASNCQPAKEFVCRGTDAGARMDMSIYPGETASPDGLTIYETSSVGVPHHATTEIDARSIDGHTAELEDFLTAVAQETAPERNTVEQGLVVQRVMDAIYDEPRLGQI
jgi:predicted dehydrogenase